MSEFEIRDDCCVNFGEIQDGEAIFLQLETPEGITDEIILTRSVALQLARIIIEIMEKDEKEG